MEAQDIAYFKEKLDAELITLGNLLATRGHQIDESGDWAATIPEPDLNEEDPTYTADRMEEFDTNVATVTELEQRHQQVVAALNLIEDGAYGICSVTKQPIERERLEANPAADTCIAAAGK